jgi:uncharacterized lipoprotein YmbA
MKKVIIIVVAITLASCSSSRKMESCDYLSKKMSGYNYTNTGTKGYKY